jgi:hypothetical protein
MAKVILGNHPPALPPWQDRDSIRKFYCQNSNSEKNPRLPLQKRTARNPSSWRAPEPCDSNSLQDQILLMAAILSAKTTNVLICPAGKSSAEMNLGGISFT